MFQNDQFYFKFYFRIKQCRQTQCHEFFIRLEPESKILLLIVHWTHKVKLKFFIKLSKNFRFSQYHRLWSIAWKPKFRPKITIFDVVKTLFRFLLLSYLLPKVLKLIDLIKNRHIAIKTIDLILVQNILFFNFLFSKFHIFFPKSNFANKMHF